MGFYSLTGKKADFLTSEIVKKIENDGLDIKMH